MRTTLMFCLLSIAPCGEAQVTHELVTDGFSFVPDLIEMTTGDSVHLTLNSVHTCTEVSEATWNANGNTPNGGFNYGPGTPNPGEEHTFAINTAGTYYFVCLPHADMGMKGRFIVTGPNVGIAETSAGDIPHLYPNPASGSVQLYPPPGGSRLMVMVYDMQGRNVMSLDTRGMTTLDTQELEPGKYEVVTTDEQGRAVQRERLLIIRY